VSQCDVRFYFGGVSRGLVYIDPTLIFFIYFCTTVVKSIDPATNIVFLHIKQKLCKTGSLPFASCITCIDYGSLYFFH
jgi:hypothetical protein